MFHRGFRGSRRRSMPRAINKTYKKVLNFANASFSPGTENVFLVRGQDSVAIGQVSATDGNVPTGSVVKFIEVQFAVHNSVETPCFVNCTLQYKLQSQSTINPDTVGGDAQRNQVLHQDLFAVGALQNSTHKFKFKIPKRYQRVRELMDWVLVWSNTATVNRQIQIIYKVQL